jgi:hypothetical protein
MKKIWFRFPKPVQALLLAMLVVSCFSSCKDADPAPNFELPKSEEKAMRDVKILADEYLLKAELQTGGNWFLFLVPLELIIVRKH